MGTAPDGLSAADPARVGPLDTGRRASAVSVLAATVRRLRRGLLLMVFLAALAWIITIIVLITLHPVAGTGNPMD